jgi:TatD DNase family protein
VSRGDERKVDIVTDGPVRTRYSEVRGARERPPTPEPLPVPVPDSHCHLDIADPPEDWFSVDDALAASTAVGVPRIVQVGYDLASSRWSVQTARKYAEIVAAVAVHPNESPLLAKAGTLDDALAEIDTLAEDPDVRAIGETGLDHFRTGPDGRADQEASFRAHIELAKRHGKALVIHDRDAHDELLRVLEDAGPPDRVVFHCYSGDVAMAEHCVRRGWWLSFAGTVTFSNARGLREALAVVPLDRMLVETDAPFLTPTPYRGRPNASYLIPLTLRAMAEVLEVEEARLATAIAQNTEAAFGHW